VVGAVVSAPVAIEARLRSEQPVAGAPACPCPIGWSGAGAEPTPAGTATDRAVAASSFGREHGRRVSRRASPVQPGLGRFAAVVGRRATRPLATARPRRWAVATFARALERAKVTALSPGVGASTPEWGPFRTLNWTLNAKSRPHASGKRSGGGRKTYRLAGETGKWRGPESNRGHHDFQAVASGALRRRKPHKNAVDGGAGARPVPADAGRCAWV
jgi:hypothetical protein